jgi:hypothetical protein
MCKNSVYLVKKTDFIHNKFTLDEFRKIKTVNIPNVVHNLLRSFQRLIPTIFYFYKGIFVTFARFPQQLLLLLLLNKLNIINKTNLNWSFK